MTTTAADRTSAGRYHGQVVMVTGAARGLGRGIAEKIGAEGASLALCDADQAGLQTAAAEIHDRFGIRVVDHVVDVSVEDDVTQWAGEVIREFGRVDVLVSNAGIIRDARVENMSAADFDRVLDVHLRGAFLTVRAVFPEMKRAGYGRILTLASMSWRGNFGQANYSSAKAGIVGLSRTIALEGAPHGITANVIAPGPIQTPMLDEWKAEIRERWCASVPVRRIGEPADIAAAAAYLCSTEAGFVTGVVLDVDGGLGVGVSLR